MCFLALASVGGLQSHKQVTSQGQRMNVVGPSPLLNLSALLSRLIVQDFCQNCHYCY